MTDRDAPVWRKATFSNNGGACVEVCFAANDVLIRDSKYLRVPGNNPAAQPMIAVPIAVWGHFLTLVLGESIDSNDSRIPTIKHRVMDDNTVLQGVDGSELIFTSAEWAAFISGVIQDEFSLRARGAPSRC